MQDLEGFYNGTGKAIPWSNTNADWQDINQECEDSTTVPAGTISTTPYYPITSIGSQTIPTYGVGEATAIANIQNVLNQDKAVFFGFYMAENSDWSALFSFWATQGEDVIWDPDYSCGHTWDNGGGHAVLCVGYNDDPGTDNDYWIMLNSWGTTGGRPNGLLRVDMHLNYDCFFYYPYPDAYYSFYWETLDIVYSTPSTAINIVGKNGDDAISQIVFPPGLTNATVSSPFNDLDGPPDHQILSGTASEPVVRLRNTSAGALIVWLSITDWENGVVTSEDYELVASGTNVNEVDEELSSDGNASSVDTGVAIPVGGYLDLYLEVVLSALEGVGGGSTLTILGETT